MVFTAYLTEQKYNDVLQRHGQYVRWLQGIACNCVDDAGRVDPRCAICQGRGRIYRYQKSIRWDNENSRHNLNCVQVSYPPIRNVHSITRCGLAYTVDSISGAIIAITVPAGSELRLPRPHERITVDYEQDVISLKEITDVTIYSADNIIQLNGLTTTITRNDQVRRQFPLDMVSVVKVEDTTDEIELSVSEYERDMITIEAEQKEFSITAIQRTSVPYSIEVGGKATPYIAVGNTISIINHSLANGDYTVTAITYDEPTAKTTIEVTEQPADDTVEGDVKAPEYQVKDAHEFKATVKVVMPWLFLVNSVSEKMKYEDAYLGESGEAQLTVPYNINLGTGDMIVLLAAEKRGDAVLNYDAAVSEYELPAMEIKNILQIIDSTGDDEFVDGTDFLLTRKDKLKFLTAGKKPSGKFTVVYMYHPVFSILDDIPMTRTGENKRFPRKVMLKTMIKTNENFDPFKRQ